jgi:hypothetical protein
MKILGICGSQRKETSSGTAKLVHAVCGVGLKGNIISRKKLALRREQAVSHIYQFMQICRGCLFRDAAKSFQIRGSSGKQV